MACRLLSIFEAQTCVLPPRSGKSGDKLCIVNIELDGKVVHQDHELRDPFRDEEDVALHKWYLENWLKRKSDIDPYKEDEVREKAARASANVTEYRRNLFKQLRLDEAEFTDVKRLIIDVWEADKEIDSGYWIHQLLWENLEAPELWPSKDIQVMVKRIAAASSTLPNTSPVLSWPSRNITRSAPLKILIVIARKLTKTSKNDYEDVWAHLVQIHLLQIQADLKPLWMSHQIEIELVRPGNFEALERHLRQRPKGYFDLVHFDLHGDITTGDSKDAYLLFSNEDIEDPTLAPKLAIDVATLLRDREVSCVVTNACRTAVSDERRKANLSQIFVQQGICYVSAMSSRICTTAVDLFYWRFYEALIMRGFKFAEAASLGRKGLRENNRRKVNRYMMELQDWCVPVTYMRSESLQVNFGHYVPTWLVKSTITQAVSYFQNFWLRSRAKLAFETMVASFIEICTNTRTYCQIGVSSRTTSLPSGPFVHYGHDGTRQDYTRGRALPKLDINLLDLEKHLISYGVIYLHGYQANHITLRQLSPFWCCTKFVERVIIIAASQYLNEQADVTIFQWDRDDPWKSSSRRLSEVGDEIYTSSSSAKIVIIIEQIHELYPSEKEKRYQKEYRLGRERLKAFVTKRSPDLNKSAYLIFTGTHSNDWWIDDTDFEGEPFFRGHPLALKFQNTMAFS